MIKTGLKGSSENTYAFGSLKELAAKSKLNRPLVKKVEKILIDSGFE